jgi:hypothetical protein
MHQLAPSNGWTDNPVGPLQTGPSDSSEGILLASYL